jgi:hypothetical protein
MANNPNFTTSRLAQLIAFLPFPTRSIPVALPIGSRFFRLIIVVVYADETWRGASRNVIILICPSVLGTASGQIPAPCVLRSFCFV